MDAAAGCSIWGAIRAPPTRRRYCYFRCTARTARTGKHADPAVVAKNGWNRPSANARFHRSSQPQSATTSPKAMLREDPTRIGPDGRETIALHLAVSKKNVDRRVG
jgi:hypothetical protein